MKWGNNTTDFNLIDLSSSTQNFNIQQHYTGIFDKESKFWPWKICELKGLYVHLEEQIYIRLRAGWGENE